MTTGTARRPAVLTPVFVLVFIALGAAINVVGGYATTLTGLPIFLDAIGTCLVALVLGPLPGAATAILTSVVLVPVSGPGNLAFAVVGVGAALTWGFGVRGLGLGRTPARYFALQLLVVLVVSILATPIVLWLFGGGTGHPSDIITAAFARLGPWGAVFADNVLVNLVDKVFTGYIALAAARALPPHLLQGGAELPGGAGSRWVVVAATGVVIGAVLLAALLALRAAGA
jgi:energy-coupling factor transport system substrate-specific component